MNAGIATLAAIAVGASSFARVIGADASGAATRSLLLWVELDQPAGSGDCDLRFQLWDAAIGGRRITEPREVLASVTDDGATRVELDFGAAPRRVEGWLGVATRCPGGEGEYRPTGSRWEMREGYLTNHP